MGEYRVIAIGATSDTGMLYGVFELLRRLQTGTPVSDNASLGINGAILNNFNANASVLQLPYLAKVAAIADMLRPYGMKVYLSARFSAPVEIGGLATADPLDEDVIRWWVDKAAEIYRLIPDFGGFLVKANSEGQPGPQDYARSHAEGEYRLRRYVESGLALGNHSHEHLWLHQTPTEQYIADLDTAIDRLRDFDGVEPYFRFPFLG